MSRLLAEQGDMLLFQLRSYILGYALVTTFQRDQIRRLWPAWNNFSATSQPYGFFTASLRNEKGHLILIWIFGIEIFNDFFIRRVSLHLGFLLRLQQRLYVQVYVYEGHSFSSKTVSSFPCAEITCS